MIRVTITGAGGLLGRRLLSTFEPPEWEAVPLTRRELDLERPSTIAAVAASQPDVVVNCAAWTDVDGCARDPERANRINGDGAGLVAQVAARSNALVVQISTNEVFGGESDDAYAEDDPADPINPYGASKLAGERATAEATDRHLIIRTAWLYGSDRGFPARIRRAVAGPEAGAQLRLVDDEWGNPTPVGRLAASIAMAVRLALSRPSLTVLHLAGEPPTTRYGWAACLLEDDVLRSARRIKRRDFVRPSTVPKHAVLSTARSRELGIAPIAWRDVASGDGA